MARNVGGHSSLVVVGLISALLLLSGCGGPGSSTQRVSEAQTSPAPNALTRARAQLRPSLAPDRPVLVIAHRGCWRETAENSIASIEACIAVGIDMVELDVRRTADGVLILMHDETVDRTTNGSGRVADLTYAQIRGLRLKSGQGGRDAPLTGEAPPTFEAAMVTARGRILVNLDAKADVYDQAFAVLEQVGATDQIVMKRRVTPNDPALTRQPPFDRVIAMPILSDADGSAGSLLWPQLESPPAALELVFRDLAFLEAASGPIRASGARVWVNTLRPEISAGLTDAVALSDPDAVWGRLIDLGVTLIQTDHPVVLLRYLERRGRRVGLGG